MKLIFLGITLLTFHFFVLSGQNSIEVKVFDEFGEPVSYSNVVLYNVNNELITGVISSHGLASFKDLPIGDYKLCVTFIGYKDTCMSVSNKGIEDLKFTANLVPDATLLGEVVVKADRPVITVTKENNISINIENTILKNADDINNILRYLPGVIVTSDGIKVFGTSDPLFLLNGKEVFSKQEIDLLNPSDIKSIELLHSSARFDASKRTAINIITIKRKDYFGIQVYDRLIHNRALRSSSNVWIVYNKNKLQQSFSISDVIGKYKQIESSENSFYLSPDDIFETEYYARTTDKPNSHTLYYAINYDIDTNQYVGIQLYGNLNRSKMSTEIENSMSGSDSYLNETNETNKNHYFHTMLNYSRKIQKSSRLSFSGDYYTNKQIVRMDIEEPQLETAINSENKFDIYSLKGDYKFPIKNISGEFGFKIHRTENKNSAVPTVPFADDIFKFDNRLTEQSGAAYFKFNLPIKNFTLGGGLRYEYYYRKVEDILHNSDKLIKKPDLFPNFSLNYTISEKHVLMLNYSRNIDRQAYSYTSDNGFYVNPYLYRTGNINLKPQTINSISMGYVFMGFLHIQTGYANSQNYVAYKFTTQNDTIIAASYDNYAKEDLFLGISAQTYGEPLTSSLSINISKTFMEVPNKINTLEFPNFNFNISFDNTIAITKNIEGMVNFSWHPKMQHEYFVVEPVFYIYLGAWHYFFNKSFRCGFVYEYTDIQKTIMQYDYFQMKHAFSQKKHVFMVTLLYVFKYDKKWTWQNSAIESEKSRIN